jgi:radical SAM enzyme (TIGR01210 family)
MLRDQSLEVAMGLETVHPAALDGLNKRMTTDDFARAAAWLSDRDISLRVFLLIYPPFIAMEEQDRWLLESVQFAENCGASVVSLVPTRAGNGTMEALTRQGLFRAPTADDVTRSYDLVRARVTDHEPRTTSHEPRATDHGPRTMSHEPRTTSHEPRATRIFVDPWAANAH